MRLAISGIGAVSCFGAGVAAFGEGVESGESGAAPIERWSLPPECRIRLAALVADGSVSQRVPAEALRRLDRASRFALAAGREALESAGLSADIPGAVGLPADSDRDLRRRTGVAAGTNSAGMIPVRDIFEGFLREGLVGASPNLFPFTLPGTAAGQVALYFKLAGPNLTVCRKEASGLSAFAAAADTLRAGSAQAMLTGGAEDYNEILHEAYARVAELSAEGRARPFDSGRNGFVPGEGAFFVLIEPLELAQGRGAVVRGELASVALRQAPCGLHDWPSDPAPLAAVMEEALREAGAGADEVDWVCASANGTRELDDAEAAALGRVFGRRRRPVAVSSLKGAIGESGVSGPAQVIASCRAIGTGVVPPSAGTAETGSFPGVDFVRGPSRLAPVTTVLINSFGSGGALASAVIRRVL
jgi:3-oxoacyl-(acyl-carrier-protein) synthase